MQFEKENCMYTNELPLFIDVHVQLYDLLEIFQVWILDKGVLWVLRICLPLREECHSSQDIGSSSLYLSIEISVE